MFFLRMLSLLIVTLCLGPHAILGQLSAAETYTPVLAPCPAGVALVRDAGATQQNLSQEEAAYISNRTIEILPEAWGTYLTTVQNNLPKNTTLPSYVSEILGGTNSSYAYPTLAVSTSGGGYRAAIVGAGFLNALDSRNASSVGAGTGGLLQCASYLAGLSGGSWLVSSLAQANFPPLPDLIFGAPDAPEDTYGGWLAQYDLAVPSGNALQDAVLYVDVVAEVLGKALAGFPVSFGDVWSRDLARHFVNGTNADNFFDASLLHGAGVTFSSIVDLPAFASYSMPFPIIVGDSLSAKGNTSNYFNDTGVFVPLTNPIYELNPYEMGTFDPMLAAFTPMKYLGSPNNSMCATGYDQISFVIAMSSCIFNTLNLTAIFSGIPLAEELLQALAANATTLEYIEDAIVPNPFYGVAPSTYIDTDAPVLTLVDGGEDGESMPLMPLLVKSRGIDVILALDIAGNTAENWADGSSMIATQDRAAFFPSTYSFPAVPTPQATFLAQNLTTQPTFFGCSTPEPDAAPLVIYLANGGAPRAQPETPATNTSALQLSYTAAEIDVMLAQAFDIATQGMPVGSPGDEESDPEWPACLACAVVDRRRRDAGVERSGVCADCMLRYCWS